MAKPTGLRFPVHGTRIDPVYPYIDAGAFSSRLEPEPLELICTPAEVTWACRREYAATAVDVIARRTRLSFLNSEAALEALPTVIDIMSKELGWDSKRQDQEFRDATRFLTSMGLSWKRLENLTLADVREGRHREVLAGDDDCEFRVHF